LAFNKLNFSQQRGGSYSEFGLEDERVGVFCANLAANYLFKLQMYEEVVAEKNAANLHQKCIDSILRSVRVKLPYSQVAFSFSRQLLRLPDFYFLAKGPILCLQTTKSMSYTESR